MGIEEKIKGKRVYFDTNIFIYIFEGSPDYQHVIKSTLALASSGDIEIFTNEITLGELMVSPFKQQKNNIIQIYTQALNNPEFVTLSTTTQSIHIKAASIRAAYGMRYPDAVHVAAALTARCDVFLTNDKKIRPVPELEMVYVSEIKD